MKRILSAILAAAVLAAPGWSAVSAQEVSHLNQDMDNRPNLQSEQTVGGHTSAQGVSAQGVNLQNPQPSPQSRRRRPAKASKTPPHLPGPRPAHRLTAHKTVVQTSTSSHQATKAAISARIVG